MNLQNRRLDEMLEDSQRIIVVRSINTRFIDSALTRSRFIYTYIPLRNLSRSRDGIAKVCSLAAFLESFPGSWIFHRRHRRRCFTSPAGKTDRETRRRFRHFVRARTDRLKGCRARSCGESKLPKSDSRGVPRVYTFAAGGRTDIRSTVTSLIAILSVRGSVFEAGIKPESHFDRLRYRETDGSVNQCGVTRERARARATARAR